MCIELLISGNESLICRRLEDTDEDARSQAVISVVIKTYCRLWHTNITTFFVSNWYDENMSYSIFYIYGTCRCTVIYQVYLLESLCEIPGACSYKPMIENFVKSYYLHIKSLGMWHFCKSLGKKGYISLSDSVTFPWQGTLGMKNEKITRLLLEMLELDSSDYVRLMVSK